MNQKIDVYELMAKCIFGEASEAEIANLQELLKNDADLQKEYTIIFEVLKIKTGATLTTDKTQEQALSIIEKASNFKKRHDSKNRKKRYLFAAACIFLMIGLFLWIKPQNKTFPIAKNVSPIKIIDQAQNSERKKIVLKYGSTVWLNSGTQLYYSNNFEGTTREVTLKGEAFFDVKRIPEQPFEVEVNKLTVTVLGTSFNIRETDSATVVIVETGTVQVSDGHQSIVLNAGEQIIIGNTKKTWKKVSTTEK